MQLAIYQVNLDRDENGVAFESMETLAKLQPEGFDSKIYDKVYEGDLNAGDLEDVYYILNKQQPEEYTGRSLSVSDVVKVIRSEDVKPGYYYCDTIGFKTVDFEVREAV